MNSAIDTDWSEMFSAREFRPHELEELASSQLEHALDARRRGLKIYESLKNLNEVIGTQYGDRVLFELVQNAHDAHRAGDQGEIAIKLLLENDESGTLFVANRGRSFTFSNLDAIRNIGTSDKEIGEGIGNKGLGFRSVEALTDDPRIYSQSEDNRGGRFEGYCFRFASGEEIEGRLARLGAPRAVRSQVARDISRYLVPLPLTEQPDEVLSFAEAGFATVVELPLRSADAVELARKQVSALASPDAPILLFLERLKALDIQVRRGVEPLNHIRLTRRASELNTPPVAKPITLHKVELDGGAPFLVVRRVLPKEEVLEAVKESIPVAPTLKRWLEWKGDAVVSVAVGLRDEAVRTARLFNFLPMDETSVAPIHGYVDAPFFADIDRRSMNPNLPLNRYLLEAAAEACAAAALMITHHNWSVPEASVVDLITWAHPHVNKIVNGFARLNHEFTSADVWPVIAEGNSRWASLDYLYAWPDVSTKFLKPRRLAKVVEAAILPFELGSARLSRIERLAANVSKPVDLHSSVLCNWVVGVAHALAESKRSQTSQWRDFYEDVVNVFEASSIGLAELQGKAFLKSGGKRLLKAPAAGVAGAEPVFVRPCGSRGRRSGGPPKPPSSLSRRLKFFDDQVALSEETLRKFERAGLVRRYDAVEVLSGLAAAIGSKATAIQRREALMWAFRVWRATGGRAVEEALRKAKLFVPTLSGWSPAAEAFFSSSWTNSGRLLEPYLCEAADQSADCAYQRDHLLVPFSDWPLTSSQDKKSDWIKFLEIVSVRDGLQPIAGKLQRDGTPTGYWHRLFTHGNKKIGLVEAWTEVVREKRLNYPQTEYRLEGECWRLPGQLQHEALPQSAKETLSELIIAYIRDVGDKHFEFRVRHWRGFEVVSLPSPLQIFLREGEWALSFRRDEALLRRPRETWSSQTARQVPPRFVERFAAEPGHRGSAPPVLFDARIGLRDWTAPETAPERLAALANALSDLSAAERRDLRDQLRRAWADVADGNYALPKDLVLVVEREGGLEVCKADSEEPPVINLTSERQGFAARALIDQGAAVLDLGVADTASISTLLERTGGFIPRPVDSGDVRLIVDGANFQPSRSDPLLVTGELNWLSDAAVLAHEFLGDPFELRNLPPETLEQRIRQIRVRCCNDFALFVGDHKVSAQGHELAQPFPHSRFPTLLVARAGEIDLDLLVEAAPALTKLVGARRNTLETMLTRLMRHGFLGSEAGPTDEQYARAIQREVAIVRDHFAATRGSVERRVRALLPIVCFIAGDEASNQLSEIYSQLGPLLQLRNWLNEALGEDLADSVWVAVDETDDQALLRRRFSFGFSEYNAILARLGYPVLNDEEDFRRLFEVYLNELRPRLLDRVRRRYRSTYQCGESLEKYVEHKALGFVTFDPAWPLTMEELDRSFVERYAFKKAELELGPDDDAVELPDLNRLNDTNQKMTLAAHPRVASLVRAWCRKNSQAQPVLMDPADARSLVRALEQSGLFDFERLDPDQLPSLCKRISAWPTGMTETLDLGQLSLDEVDLEFEEREAREARRRAEVARRSITFAGASLDTGAPDFAQAFAELADRALASGTEWLARSRPPRLKLQDQSEGPRGGRKGGGGPAKSARRIDQPPEPIRCAMGIASEYLAREYLMQRHPSEMTDRCWVSENRGFFCSDGEKGNDSLGYDFRVVTARNEWLYEVKSALDEGGEFELTARELEVAGSAALDRKRRYRILYVPFVFDPDRWRVLTLQNPVGEATRNRFKVIRTGSVRYGFDVK
jgi:hypothetical protein